ncbi:bifunctional diaminohydroxyphosphoribosylaminopyrimidine deaminase/5-amino-6-(5-phosphoribosylamino)uracil reductase RibD [Alicyclobacillus kakegawensis]|uniref:bifunctional diaminohydroxyphosphoribosylaminopyrimidine deaminase/5-amino-6-(5-phosphoribosylamino)uracil reductase RibD n=1 Tax=Alicyclobacillus kakegawensis TaxID=392012 RepID=UPI00082D7697|nr:bifunctional diaminohydroxyphosphoribosylaminopyrimidine deaminase/5-amino-6-(5-phosphoribosylamino)uracil reductase RibD [Alicyclobacillus kakegawensis]
MTGVQAEAVDLELDAYFMRQAISLGELGLAQASPNPSVGAIIVRDGEVVGQGAHLKAGGPHAEVHALRMAGEAARGATAYVTLEPCSHVGRTPPCADALIAAGVRRVVVACTDPNPQVAGRGLARLREAGIEVVVGVEEEAAKRLHEAFFHVMATGRPLVVWKAAATLDGYIATASGHSRYVTSAAARQEVQWLRWRIPAIAVGVQTILADDPQLTVRFRSRSGVRQPLRVVLDSTLRTPQCARLLREPGRTLIYTTEAAPDERERRLTEAGEGRIDIVRLPPGADGRVPLADALADLARRGCNSVLVEGGRTLVSGLLRERLIDRVVYYLAPKLLGGGIPALDGLATVRMEEAVTLADVRTEVVDGDIRVDGRLVYPAQEEGKHGVHRVG